MPINDAQGQVIAATSQGSEQNSQEQLSGAEIDTTVSGRTKAEVPLTIEAVTERANMILAYQRVVENKGAAGVDNLSVSALKPWLKENWASIKRALMAGHYLPRAIRKMDIPKPDGGVRTLGIPPVADRLIQQAIAQKLSPVVDPSFSNIYVSSRKAGEHLLRDMSEYLTETLGLTINEKKSAVARPWERKFLGYSVTRHKYARLKVADSSVSRLKDKLRSLTTGHRSASVKSVINKLSPLLRGWISYFRCTEVKGVLEELDSWINRKLRCLLWRQWKRARTRAKKLMQAGIRKERAWRSAGNQRGAWWNSGASHMNQAIKVSSLRKAGLLSLLEQHRQFQC